MANAVKTYTREEIVGDELQALRIETIRKTVRNDILLESLKKRRELSGNESKIEIISRIREREALAIELEDDLKTIEDKINEKKKTKNNI